MRSRYKTVFSLGLILGVLITISFIYFVDKDSLTYPAVTPPTISVAPGHVVPLTDRNYAPYVLALIQDANKSIDTALFEMKYYTSEQYAGSSENQLVNALISAAERGVKIRVLLDEYADKSNNTATYTVNLLRKHNISAKLDSPTVTNHNKLLVIDGNIVVIGSTNWSYFALERNHESAVVIFDSNVATYFEDYFNHIWGE